ncbi:MAG: hypothetical protein ACTSU2_11435 [Promethearchaeota archaeon]
MVDEYSDVEDLTDTGEEDEKGDYYREEDIEMEKKMIGEGAGYYPLVKVDLWKTIAHGAIIGIKKQAQYQAQSRQFTQTMKVIGEITFYSGEEKNWILDEKYKEIVARDDKYWDIDSDESFIAKHVEQTYSDYDTKKYSKLMRKLIIKTFVSLDNPEEKAKGRWTGTIEESQIMSLALTFGEKDPLPFFYIDIPGYKYRIPLFRTHAVTGERFVFVLYDDDEEVLPFYIEGKRLTPGSDYTVFNEKTGEKVAFIDDRATNIGGRVDIKMYKEFEDINSNRIYRRVLILFSAASKFLHDIYDNYKVIYKGLVKNQDFVKEQGKGKLSPEDLQKKYEKAKAKMELIREYRVWPKELTLHFNPRRIRS